ncbi:MAG: tRNA-His guanylyltransferase [Chaenotheca gracillima]|nr:MAG: tRNA-His guanylyltransferase [Chaenotheca gracillima]
MDTAGYLSRQGWLGAGYSLHGAKGDNRGAVAGGRGLAKPILVSQKSNTHGIGKKKNDLSDQWWLRAFDRSLTELDVSGSSGAGTPKAGDGTATPDTGAGAGVRQLGLPMGIGARDGGLYGRFVRGEGLIGTIGKKNDDEQPATKKRKRHADVDVDVSDTQAHSGTLKSIASAREGSEELLKEERRSRRRERKAARKERQLAAPLSNSTIEDSAREKTKKRRKHEKMGTNVDSEALQNVPSTERQDLDARPSGLIESSDERSRRKEAKKLRKAHKAGLISEAEAIKPSDLTPKDVQSLKRSKKEREKSKTKEKKNKLQED